MSFIDIARSKVHETNGLRRLAPDDAEIAGDLRINVWRACSVRAYLLLVSNPPVRGVWRDLPQLRSCTNT